MKKLYLLGAVAGALLLSVSCSSGKSHEGHNHEGHNHDHATEAHAGHDHAHEGHNHDGHSHEGHSHEGHNHDAHEGHNHDAHAGHNHGGGSSDEIVIPSAKAQAVGIVSENIQPTAFRQVITTSGQVEAAQGDEATVVANVSGMVSFNKAVTDGMSVGKGATLLTIATSRTADGDPAQRAKIAYETAKEEYDRASKLVESKIVSAKEFAVIRQNYENAKLSYEALAGGSKGDGKQAILAPIGGYVKNCLVKEGDYVTVGQPLVSITQNRRLFLRAEVSEKYYKYLRQIKSANFQTPYDNTVYSLDDLRGRVLSFGKASGDTSYFIPITFEFDNKGDIIPGSYVEVFLLSNEMPNVLALPKSALTEEQGIFFVYLQLDAECYKKQEVTLGADNGKEVQILSGIKPGDRVVVKGAYHVKLASASNAIPAHSHEH